VTRLAHAYRALTPEQRLAALAALGLFVSMLLPWYSKSDTLVVHGAAKATATSLSAFQAFSFVEAAVLLVSAAVLAMLFARAEGRDFPLPGGDGVIVMVAGGWAALLIFYRLLDKPGSTRAGAYARSNGRRRRCSAGVAGRHGRPPGRWPRSTPLDRSIWTRPRPW
jgi:hypothetical protein